MKPSHHFRFTSGAIRAVDPNPVYFVPPGVQPNDIAPPAPQSQSEQVLKIQKVKPRRSKYQRD